MFTFQREQKIAPEDTLSASLLDDSVEKSDTVKKEYEFDSSTMPKLSNKFKNSIQATAFDGGETNLSALEDMLENEKQSNKLAAWNKLDKTDIWYITNKKGSPGQKRELKNQDFLYL